MRIISLWITLFILSTAHATPAPAYLSEEERANSTDAIVDIVVVATSSRVEKTYRFPIIDVRVVRASGRKAHLFKQNALLRFEHPCGLRTAASPPIVPGILRCASGNSLLHAPVGTQRILKLVAQADGTIETVPYTLGGAGLMRGRIVP